MNGEIRVYLQLFGRSDDNKGCDQLRCKCDLSLPPPPPPPPPSSVVHTHYLRSDYNLQFCLNTLELTAGLQKVQE